MDTATVERIWIADGNAVNVDCGFIPNRCILFYDYEQTNPLRIDWSYNLYKLRTAYGLLTTGSSGVITQLSTAATGIIPYDSSSATPTINEYTTTVSTAATARTATAAGTYVKPSTSSTMDRDAVFECVTAGTGAAEPTWPLGIGEQILETAGDVVWERVNVARENGGFQGVTVGATTQTDGYYCVLYAERGDSKDLGNADNILPA